MDTDIECPHCGGKAASGDQVAALLALGMPGECDSCAHPGRVERDKTGTPAFLLNAGRCNDGKCDACLTDLFDGLVNATLERGVVELPDANELIALAEDVALALRESPRAALKRIVDDFHKAATAAARHFALKEMN